AIVLTDINMPGISGIEILKQVKQVSPMVQVIVFSGFGTTDNVIEALRLGASDYLAKPFNLDLLLHTIARCIERYTLIKERMERKVILEEKVRERTAALTHTFHETVRALGLITEKRDPYTAGHQSRVALLAVAIGRKLGLTPGQIETIKVAGLLHDIGKVAVPVELLVKPSRLSTIEKSLMKTHPQTGYEIIKDIPFVKSLGQDVSRLVRNHHERIDGSGYPRGLHDDQLELEAKIICVADVIEAMSSHRPYRPALDMAAAKAEILEKREKAYCPECVDACIQLIEAHHDDSRKLFTFLETQDPYNQRPRRQ
ncbi:MAG: HD domain-containing protein, partial [Desulfobacterales bacterium]|nr:HD domain-containing protein [Desulfobacterales bacterium]